MADGCDKTCPQTCCSPFGCITFARLWGFLHFNDLWLLFSTISRRYLDFEQDAYNFNRSWYKIYQNYSILKVAQSYTYLSHILRNWVAQMSYFYQNSRANVLLSLCILFTFPSHIVFYLYTKMSKVWETWTHPFLHIADNWY